MTGPAAAVVAIEVGTSATRVAALGPDGRPELPAVLPAGTTARAAVQALHGDAPIGTLVLVHPSGSDAGSVAATVDLPAGRAATVCTLPAPVAALAGLADPGDDTVPRAAPGDGGARRADLESGGARSRETPAARLVVDAGAGGTELTLVVGDRALLSERVPVGGDRLDALLASASGLTRGRARAVREALSTRTEVTLPEPRAPARGAPVPAVTAPGSSGAGPAWPGGTVVTACLVRELMQPVLAEVAGRVREVVARSGAVEVVLLGGLARTPLLAELVDEVVSCPVHVLAAPETAAVLGAVTRPRPALRVPDPPPGTGEPGAGAGRPGDGPGVGAATKGRRWRVRGAPIAVVLGLALIAAGAMAGRAPERPVSGLIVQYGYVAALPAGWEHTGGLPERRRTLLTRTASPDGAELIALERSPLGYDSALEAERARAELLAEYRRTSAAQHLRDLREETVAGRRMLRYRQDGPGAAVDWYVLFAGTDELVVGCRHPDAPTVAPACTAVVASIRPAAS